MTPVKSPLAWIALRYSVASRGHQAAAANSPWQKGSDPLAVDLTWKSSAWRGSDPFCHGLLTQVLTRHGSATHTSFFLRDDSFARDFFLALRSSFHIYRTAWSLVPRALAPLRD